MMLQRVHMNLTRAGPHRASHQPISQRRYGALQLVLCFMPCRVWSSLGWRLIVLCISVVCSIAGPFACAQPGRGSTLISMALAPAGPCFACQKGYVISRGSNLSSTCLQVRLV